MNTNDHEMIRAYAETLLECERRLYVMEQDIMNSEMILTLRAHIRMQVQFEHMMNSTSYASRL